VSDAVNLERMSIPTVTFVTEPFVPAARATAAALGMPGLPLVVIPHDYLVEGAASVVAKVTAVLDDVVAALFA
jgi:hypothetical protein